MYSIEHHTQQACVNWFRYQFKAPDYVIFAIPNGGVRHKSTGRTLKIEGVMAGVADLCILARGRTIFVEMKADSGKQTPAQKEFQNVCFKQGIPYVIAHSLDEFIFWIQKLI